MTLPAAVIAVVALVLACIAAAVVAHEPTNAKPYKENEHDTD